MISNGSGANKVLTLQLNPSSDNGNNKIAIDKAWLSCAEPIDYYCFNKFINN